MDPVVAVGVGVLWLLFNLFGRKKPSSQSRPTRPPIQPQPAGRAPRLQGVSLRGAPEAVVDFDDEAEGIAARRIAAVLENERPLGTSDRIKFDERIRREAADATATPKVDLAQLRNAVVWREILGPPVSLRHLTDQ